MAKVKPNFEVKELNVSEAIDKYKCTIDRIYFGAATEQLNIYAKTDTWQVLRLLSISKIDKSILLQASDDDFLKTLSSNLSPGRIGLFSTDMFGSKEARWRRKANAIFTPKDDPQNYKPVPHVLQIVSNRRLDMRGLLQGMSGFRPISPLSIRLCRLRSEAVDVLLQYPDGWQLPGDPSFEYIVVPTPLLTFQEARDQGKLYVKTIELEKYLSDESQSHDDENIPSASHAFAAAGSDHRIGLTIKELASAFRGVVDWDEKKWGKYLDCRLEWVRTARLSEGQQGGIAATFHPVLVAIQLKKKSTKQWEISNSFRDGPTLQPWADQWHDSQSPFKNYSK